jgi:hypothetical protein
MGVGMGKLVSLIFSIIGLLATLIAAFLVVYGIIVAMTTKEGGFLPGFAAIRYFILAGITWLVSLIFLLIAYLTSRNVKSIAIASLMWIAAAINLAGFILFAFTLGPDLVKVGIIPIILILWSVLLIVMGLRRK